MVLGGMFQSGDIEKERLMQTVLVADFVSSVFRRPGKKTVVFQPIGNHDNPFTRQAKKLKDVAGGIFADRDDLILAFGELADNDASVSHPFPIIFSRDMEGGE